MISNVAGVRGTSSPAPVTGTFGIVAPLRYGFGLFGIPAMKGLR